MKPIYIDFKDCDSKVIKTHSTCSLKTGMMDNIFDIAEAADELNRPDVDLKEIKVFYKNLKAIIVEIFGDKFTLDELNKNVEQEDLMKVFRDITQSLKGDMAKK